MGDTSFDTLGTARDLEAVGFERGQAEAIALAIGRTDKRVATKADLAPLATKAELEPLAAKADLVPLATMAELSALETRLTNRFCGIAFALAGVIIASANLFRVGRTDPWTFPSAALGHEGRSSA